MTAFANGRFEDVIASEDALREIDDAFLNLEERGVLGEKLASDLISNWLIVDNIMSYKVKNIGTSEEIYTIPLTVEKNLSAPEHSVLEPKLGFISIFDGATFKSRDESSETFDQADRELREPTKDLRAYAFPITIPPETSVDIRVHYRLLRRKIDKELWRSNYVSSSFHLTCTYPKGYKIALDPVLSVDFKQYLAGSETTGRTTKSAGSQRGLKIKSVEENSESSSDLGVFVTHIDPKNQIAQCIVRHSIFPGNGVLIWWAPSNAAIQQEAPQQSDTKTSSP